MKNKKLLVIIPAYNEEKHINNCIQSIMQCDYPKNKYEIIDAVYTLHSKIIIELFSEYASGLAFSLAFQNFEHELKNIENEYFPPSGSTLLLKFGTQFIGCVAFRKFDDNICEMKRMYIILYHAGVHFSQ